MARGRILGVPAVVVDRVFARCARDVFPPLATEGARRLGGRFNPPGMPALYLAPSPTLALAESTRANELAGFVPFAPRRLVCVHVRLSAVIDLTKPAVVEALGVVPEELTGDWLLAEELTPTQELGDKAFRERAEGILFPSRLDEQKANLVVFPDNLHADSRLEIVAEDR